MFVAVLKNEYVEVIFMQRNGQDEWVFVRNSNGGIDVCVRGLGPNLTDMQLVYADIQRTPSMGRVCTCCGVLAWLFFGCRQNPLVFLSEGCCVLFSCIIADTCINAYRQIRQINREINHLRQAYGINRTEDNIPPLESSDQEVNIQ